MANARVADGVVVDGGVSLIFVYGTLKRGFYNHSLISDLVHTGDAAFIGPRATLDAFPLVCGPNGIPYLINLPGSGQLIRGELYSVSSDRGLARLDELEGVDRAHYERLPVAVVSDGGDEVVHAEAYFAHRGFGEAMRKRCGEEGLMSEYTLEMGRKYVRREDRPPRSCFLHDINKFISEGS
ncbi:putative gamma-glutamylcyclotransferase At3g02910 [Primulina huaijiensis]|uniref:putative gamma-glutamylcyclotransferase At3g02910 n=1 Tax=Primulina huaijiensis TaxID=1492673 RepID=UPI003CC72446